MSAPDFNREDFAQQLLALLPRGKVWPRDLNTTIRSVMDGLAVTYERGQARANNLLVDAFPASAVELLSDWEASLGLPDPCAGPQPTIEARRAQVVARLTASGGQSVAYFIAFAKQLGYAITIEEFAPFRTGESSVGDPLNSADWANAWAVHAPLHTVQYFRTGVAAVGEPLAYWSNDVLECELNTVKPAHTELIFKYT
jgi:uncharacterized protein YmfQ (DUF2313 family)